MADKKKERRVNESFTLGLSFVDEAQALADKLRITKALVYRRGVEAYLKANK